MKNGETKNIIGCNNIRLWLDNNIFKSNFKQMNNHKIKLIINILSESHKEKKIFKK